MPEAQIKRIIDSIRQRATEVDEDYPGQSNEYIQQEVIRLAVGLVDDVVIEASDGTVEQTDLLTTEIMYKLVEQVLSARRFAVRRKALEERIKLGDQTLSNNSSSKNRD